LDWLLDCDLPDCDVPDCDVPDFVVELGWLDWLVEDDCPLVLELSVVDWATPTALLQAQQAAPTLAAKNSFRPKMFQFCLMFRPHSNLR
jgi:hypothetical protein